MAKTKVTIYDPIAKAYRRITKEDAIKWLESLEEVKDKIKKVEE